MSQANSTTGFQNFQARGSRKDEDADFVDSMIVAPALFIAKEQENLSSPDPMPHQNSVSVDGDYSQSTEKKNTTDPKPNDWRRRSHGELMHVELGGADLH